MTKTRKKRIGTEKAIARSLQLKTMRKRSGQKVADILKACDVSQPVYSTMENAIALVPVGVYDFVRGNFLKWQEEEEARLRCKCVDDISKLYEVI